MTNSSDISHLVKIASQPLIELEGHKETIAAYLQRGMSRQEAMRQEQLYGTYVAIDKAQVLAKGKILTEARERAEHGTWTEIVLPRYGITERTAQNLMNAWKRFGDDPESVARLKPSAVYVLSAPDTPEEFVAEIIEESRNGKDFTVHEIKERRKGLMVQPPRSVTDGSFSDDIDSLHITGSRDPGQARVLRAQALGLVLAEFMVIVNDELVQAGIEDVEADEHAIRNAKSLATRAYGMIVTDPSLGIIQRHLLITEHQQPTEEME